MSKASESLSPDAVARIEREQRAAEQNGAIGNLLGVIDRNVSQAIKDLEAERDAKVAEVLALNARITRLRTHELVGGEAS